VRGDLVATLEDLLRRRDNGRIEPFRQVLIETTGLADPLPILQSVLQHPYLSKRFAITGIVTLVDATHGADTLARFAEARRQVALADTLLLTKTELASAETLATLRAALAGLNPGMPVLETEPEGFAAGLFTNRFAPAEAEAVPAWLAEAGLPPAAGNPGHTGNLESFSFVADTAITPEALTVFQEAMRILHGPRLLRMKGIIALTDDPERPAVIHHVQSMAHPPQRLARWPGRDRRSKLVFIVEGIPRETIAGFWNALFKAGGA
jgi:G3E family GTPase